MGTLVRTIGSIGLAAYGVNLLDIAPPASGLGVISRVLGIVGDFPWGPVNTVTTCYSFKDLQAFFPAAFSALYDNYPALKAFLGKPTFPGPIKVCRIAATGAAAAVLTYNVAGGTIVGTAAYSGTAGNSIALTWAAATDADASHRNLTITIGSNYSALYENVTLTTITALGDAYMSFAKGSTPSALPAIAANPTTTAAGLDGTAAAADYTGSSTSNVGIYKFYASNQNVDVLMVAECPAALINSVNTALVSYNTTAGKMGQAVLCSVAAQSASAAVAYVASYRDTVSKTSMIWPRPKVTNTFDKTGSNPLVTVDGNAFLALAMLGVNPWESPEGVNSVPWLTGVQDLETNDASDTAYAALNAAGISTFFIDDTLGPIIRGAYVTNTTSGQTDIIRSSYRAYVQANVAALAIHYVGVPLSVDLQGQNLGDTVSPLVTAIKGFLTDEQTKQHFAGYAVDPYGPNTQADIDAGHWTIAIAIDTYAPLRQIVIQTQIGSTVVIS